MTQTALNQVNIYYVCIINIILHLCIDLDLDISNTSREHLCILSRKYFSITSVDREKSENQNDIYFMAFALKGTMLKIVKEKVISTCGRGIT